VIPNFSRLAAPIALLILLSGCGPQKYRSLDLLPKTNTFISKDASIQGSYTILDSKASKAYLGADVLEKGYQPIYISLTNTSNHTLRFSESNINIPVVPANRVAQAAHKNTVGRAIGFGAPGAIGATGAVGYSLLCTAFLGVGFIFIPLGIAAGAVCLAPSVMSTSDAIKTNANIDMLFNEKALKDQLLPLHSTMSGLIFVQKENFNPNFEISLTDSLNRPLILASNPAQTTAVA